MQDHGNINRRKLILDGWGQRYRERRLICVESSHGCRKGTEVGEGFFW